MKKYQIITVAICLLLNCSYAQYGSRKYAHPNSFLTSAKVTNLNMNGFVMAGSVPTAAGTQPDFSIDQTDASGTFTGGWSTRYTIQSDPDCDGLPNPMVRQYGCIGVDVIETNPGGSINYAIAGMFGGGLFFACLDGTGTPTTTRFWPIAAGNSTHRPMIRESATAGDYYICGDDGGSTYVIKINTASTIIWSKRYSSFPIEARALIESPYNSNELIVVGRCDPGSGLATEGFFLKINAGNGNVISTTCYSDGGNGDEWFTSIEPAVSTAGGSDGYIIGGRIHSIPTNNTGFKPWMIKLDPSGNVVWSTLIQHSISSNPLEIYDVFERYNPNGSTSHEYYGVAHTSLASSDAMTVWKVDDNGGASLTPSEFSYALGTSVAANYNPTQLEFIGNGSTTGDGLIAFGTDETADDHILFKAYYNGEEGCVSQTDWTHHYGPGISLYPTLTASSFVSPCIYFQLNQGNSTTAGTYCYWGSPTGGSNARSSNVTGLNDNRNKSDQILVHPNPSNKLVTVNFEKLGSQTAKINVTNSLGQVVKAIEYAGDQQLSEVTVNFEELGVCDGLYFINVTANNETKTTKVVYRK